MTTDLRELRGTLRARAEADVDAEALLERVGPASRRRRTRRAAGAAAAVAALGVLVAVLMPRLLLGSYPLPAPPAFPITSLTAKDIGADPGMIHFDVGDLPYRVNAQWSVGDGAERLSLWGPGFVAELTLAAEAWSPSADPTRLPEPTLPSHPETVAGWPAVVATGEGRTRVTWRPMDGVRAELSVTGALSARDSLAFARTLRLDRGHPCVPRLRPTALPPGARITGCSISPAAGIGEYTISGPGGTILVAIPSGVFPYGISPGAYPGPPPTLSNGWAYQELSVAGSSQHLTAFIRVPDPWVEIRAQGGYGMPEVLLVGGGLRPA